MRSGLSPTSGTKRTLRFRLIAVLWRMVKWYHKGLWNLCSRFESWSASNSGLTRMLT